MIRRSKSRFISPDCSEYKYPNDCNSDVNCFYDYNEKECRRKRSPSAGDLNFNFQNEEQTLPLTVHEKIQEYLIKDHNSDLFLLSQYPHNPSFILENIENASPMAIARLLNYIPYDDKSSFVKKIISKILKQYKDMETNLAIILGMSGNVEIINYFLIKTFKNSPNVYSAVLTNIIEQAMAEGHYDAAQYLLLKHSNRRGGPSIGELNNAAFRGAIMSGDVNMVDYYMDIIRPLPDRATRHIIGIAATYGHLNVLKYLLTKLRVDNLDYEHILNSLLNSIKITYSVKLKILKFLLNQNEYFPLHFIHAMYSVAERNGDVRLIKFLFTKLERISENNVEVLYNLLEYGIVTNKLTLINFAISKLIESGEGINSIIGLLEGDNRINKSRLTGIKKKFNYGE